MKRKLNLKKTLAVAVAIASSSTTYAYNYGEVLQKAIYFYEAQQSGTLPDWNRVEWRGDAAVDDGSDNSVDLEGGWFDAGDHVKFGFPMAASATMLAMGVVEYPEAYSGTGQLEHIKNNLSFVADYFVKAHTDTNELYGQVGSGSADHAWWGSAEVMTMDRPSYKIDEDNPGSDLAAETAAALAAISMVFEDDDPDYAEELLEHAIELYDFADTYRGTYDDSITDASSFYASWSGYQDEIVWGAIWLYRATGDETYLDKAIEEYDDLNTEGQTSYKSYTWTHAWDDKSYGSYVLMAKATNELDDYDSSEYEADAERWLDYWAVGYDGDQVTYTDGGLAYLSEWGAARYTANTSFLALIYSDFLNDKSDADDDDLESADDYYDFAVSQMEYILGDNPMNMSYQIGYGDTYPTAPHHRTAHGSWANSSTNPTDNRHTLIGALVGGPDSNDDFENDRTDYILNEVATDYNAGFTGAAARLWLDYGGDAIDDDEFPEAEERDNEFYIEAKVNSTGTQYLEIAALTYNHSAWPARASEELKFRYFMDLTEEFALDYSIDDIAVESNYNQATEVSGPTYWSDNIYYVEANFDGILISPISSSDSQKEVQFRMRLPYDASGSWDYSSDPSWDDDFSDGYAEATSMVLYDGDDIVWGEEPEITCSDDDSCAPTADDVTATTEYETSVTIDLSAEDSDGSVSSYAIASEPEDGSVEILSDTAVYTPDDGFYGEDSFTYTATDNDGEVSSPATVTVTVAEPEDAAVSITSLDDGDEVETDESVAVTVDIENAEGANIYLDSELVATLSNDGTAYVTMPSYATTVEILVIATDDSGTEYSAEDSVYLTVVEAEVTDTDDDDTDTDTDTSDDTDTDADTDSEDSDSSSDTASESSSGSMGWATLFMLPLLVVGRQRRK